MRYLFISCLAVIMMFSFSSCEKDEGKLPEISFKTGGTYLSTNSTVTAGATFVVGINASKSEDKDVLNHFNISKSVNSGSNTSVYDQDLTGSDGDDFSYDYNGMMDSTIGTVDKYTFTVTNRDGLVNQVSITLTAQ